MVHHRSVGWVHGKKECYLLNIFTVFINFLYIFCFSWKILYFYHFAFLFWWSVKSLHHKINQSETGIDLGDKKLLFKAMKAMMDTISLFQDILKHNAMHYNSLLFILSIKIVSNIGCKTIFWITEMESEKSIYCKILPHYICRSYIR